MSASGDTIITCHNKTTFKVYFGPEGTELNLLLFSNYSPEKVSSSGSLCFAAPCSHFSYITYGIWGLFLSTLWFPWELMFLDNSCSALFSSPLLHSTLQFYTHSVVSISSTLHSPHRCPPPLLSCLHLSCMDASLPVRLDVQMCASWTSVRSCTYCTLSVPRAPRPSSAHSICCF